MLTFAQAIALGILQGVTELFPVSSLGHSVILPQLLGWSDVVASQSAPESYFLAFLVGLHVATALALIVFYRETWAGILRGYARTVRLRRVESADQKIGCLLLIATIPAGLAGLLLEHALRVVFATPLAAASFLVVNGLLLLVGDRLGRRSTSLRPDGSEPHAGRRMSIPGYRDAFAVGASQALALLPGISRSGVTMVVGLARGLTHEEAARFSFLLATPIILAAGIYKLPDLLGPNGDGVRPQIIAGSVAAGVSAYLAVRFLTRFFQHRSLRPFAVYCLVAGPVALVRFWPASGSS